MPFKEIRSLPLNHGEFSHSSIRTMTVPKCGFDPLIPQ